MKGLDFIKMKVFSHHCYGYQMWQYMHHLHLSNPLLLLLLLSFLCCRCRRVRAGTLSSAQAYLSFYPMLQYKLIHSDNFYELVLSLDQKIYCGNCFFTHSQRTTSSPSQSIALISSLSSSCFDLLLTFWVELFFSNHVSSLIIHVHICSLLPLRLRYLKNLCVHHPFKRL